MPATARRSTDVEQGRADRRRHLRHRAGRHACCANAGSTPSCISRPRAMSTARSAAPDAFIETNVIGTHSLLKAARQVWLDRVRAARTASTMSRPTRSIGSLGPSDPAFSETTPYAPNSPYSASKAGSDHLVRAYHHTFGLEVTTSNCSNNYGPYQYPEKLIPLFLLNALMAQAAADLWRRHERARLAACRGSLPRDRGGADRTASRARPTISAAGRNCPT